MSVFPKAPEKIKTIPNIKIPNFKESIRFSELRDFKIRFECKRNELNSNLEILKVVPITIGITKLMVSQVAFAG